MEGSLGIQAKQSTPLTEGEKILMLPPDYTPKDSEEIPKVLWEKKSETPILCTKSNYFTTPKATDKYFQHAKFREFHSCEGFSKTIVDINSSQSRDKRRK